MIKSPFEYIKSFNNKEYIWDDSDTKEFLTWMINKGMSYTMDTVFYANEANKMKTLDKKLVHDWYFYAVPKKNRFGKWQKKEKESEIIQLLMETYTINNIVAAAYLKIMNKEQLDIIKQRRAKGG